MWNFLCAEHVFSKLGERKGFSYSIAAMVSSLCTSASLWGLSTWLKFGEYML